jgi:hypothetical protein
VDGKRAAFAVEGDLGLEAELGGEVALQRLGVGIFFARRFRLKRSAPLRGACCSALHADSCCASAGAVRLIQDGRPMMNRFARVEVLALDVLDQRDLERVEGQASSANGPFHYVSRTISAIGTNISQSPIPIGVSSPFG